MVALAFSAIDAAKVAVFAPAVLAQAGGQALFVGCTAAFATQRAADPKPLLLGALLGVLLKGAGQAGAVAIQARWVARVGQVLRAGLLGGSPVGKSLHRPGHEDHGSLGAEVPAELAARIEDVERGVGEGLLPAVRAGAELLPLLGLVLWTAPRFAVLALLVIGPLALLLARGKTRLARAIAAHGEARSRLLTAFDTAVRHDDLWRVHGHGHVVQARVEAAAAAQGVAAARVAVRTELASTQNEALGVVFVWTCVALAPDMASAPGLLLRFLAAFFLTYKPLRQLIVARAAFARGATSLRQLPAMRGSVPVPPSRIWPMGRLDAEVRVSRGTRAHLTIALDPGAVLLVTGPSGCGKTTLLRSLLGLISLEGSLSYAGVELVASGVGPDQRPFAWMPQSCPVAGDSVADALWASGDRAAVAAELLAGVRGNAHTLSGGEAQRVALVRALSTPLPVVLLDEPTSQLDDALSERLVDALARESAAGRSFVVATHEPARFRRLSRVAEISLAGGESDFSRGEAAQ